MVDFFVTQAPVSRYATDSGDKKVNVLSFDATVPVNLQVIGQIKTILSVGSVRELRRFLLKTFDELKDIAQFNLILLSANTVSEEQSVNMEVILKSSIDFPVVRLVDSKGDFCVVRFDR